MTNLAVTLLALGACTAQGPVHTDIAYDGRFGDSTTMDIHLPSAARANGPAIMLIHGGAWEYGDKEAYTEAAERFARAGYVAATINYRLIPARYPAPIQDCLCALAFLRANADRYGIDPGRVAVTGYSAGGHLAALVATSYDHPAHQPDCRWGAEQGPLDPPAAAIPADAIYDFTASANPWIVELIGASYAADPEPYHSISPIEHVRPGLPPFLVVHGHDDVVAVEGASALVDSLRAMDNAVSFLHIDGAGHVLSPTTATDGAYLQTATEMPEAWAATLDFLALTVGAP